MPEDRLVDFILDPVEHLYDNLYRANLVCDPDVAHSCFDEFERIECIRRSPYANGVEHHLHVYFDPRYDMNESWAQAKELLEAYFMQ